MRKSFVQNIAFLILVNLIVKPFWVFGIDRNVQNLVGHEVYGLYQAIFNITIIFQILLDFGLQSYNSRTVSQSPAAMRNLFPNIVVVKSLFAFVYAVITFTFGAVFGYDSNSFLLLGILVLMQIAISFLLFFRSNIAALQRFKTDSLFSVADRIIAIIIMAVLLFTPAFKNHFLISWYAWVQCISYSIAALLALLLCLRLCKIEWKNIHLHKIIIVVKRSIPYALLIFLMSIYTRIDTILLEYISIDSSIAGKYAAAFRLLDVSNNMSGVLIAGILLPLFGKMISKKEDYNGIVNLCIRLLLPFSITVAVICAFWNFEILHLLYKDIDSIDGQILMWLMLSFPLYCLNYVYATLLTANGNIRQLIVISAIGLVLNLGLNLVFIQAQNELNGVFAARNAFITLLIVCVLNILQARKNLNVSFTAKMLLQTLVFGTLLSLCSYGLYNSNWEINLMQQLTIIVFVAIILAFVTGIVQIKLILQQLKKIKQKT